MAYVVPVAADLKARYAAFAAVDNDVITYWITDALRSVDQTWTETDYAVALLALAAHNMALAGIGADGAALAGIPAGVSRLRSGSLDVSLTEAAANAFATGSFTATRYGQEFQLLLRSNRGGPLVMPTGTAPVDYLRYPQGEA